jgi:hypothetical protein
VILRISARNRELSSTIKIVVLIAQVTS